VRALVVGLGAVGRLVGLDAKANTDESDKERHETGRKRGADGKESQRQDVRAVAISKGGRVAALGESRRHGVQEKEQEYGCRKNPSHSRKRF